MSSNVVERGAFYRAALNRSSGATRRSAEAVDHAGAGRLPAAGSFGGDRHPFDQQFNDFALAGDRPGDFLRVTAHRTGLYPVKLRLGHREHGIQRLQVTFNLLCPQRVGFQDRQFCIHGGQFRLAGRQLRLQILKAHQFPTVEFKDILPATLNTESGRLQFSAPGAPVRLAGFFLQERSAGRLHGFPSVAQELLYSGPDDLMDIGSQQHLRATPAPLPVLGCRSRRAAAAVVRCRATGRSRILHGQAGESVAAVGTLEQAPQQVEALGVPSSERLVLALLGIGPFPEVSADERRVLPHNLLSIAAVVDMPAVVHRVVQDVPDFGPAPGGGPSQHNRGIAAGLGLVDAGNVQRGEQSGYGDGGCASGHLFKDPADHIGFAGGLAVELADRLGGRNERALSVQQIAVGNGASDPTAGAGDALPPHRGALQNRLPLQFRDGRQQLEDEAADGRAGIERLGRALDDHAGGFESVMGIQQDPDGAAQPVKPVHHHGLKLAGFGVGQQASAALAFPQRYRAAHPIIGIGFDERAPQIGMAVQGFRLVADGPGFMLVLTGHAAIQSDAGRESSRGKHGRLLSHAGIIHGGAVGVNRFVAGRQRYALATLESCGPTGLRSSR